MPVSFTSHNIRLDDGTYTKPDAGYSMDLHPWFLAAKRILDAAFPGDKRHLRIADLGCLEGGYTVEFARLGLQALGIDVREFLSLLSRVTKRLLILQTHFSEAKDSPSFIQPRRFRRALARILPLKNTGTTTHAALLSASRPRTSPTRHRRWRRDCAKLKPLMLQT